jgi:plastocyanin
MKHRIALFVATGLLAGGLFAGVASAKTHAAQAITVKVTMTDFHFKLVPSAPVVHGVPITFIEVNKGAALHNFDLQGIKAGKIIAHGKTAKFTVTFKKAGRFAYTCDVPRHAELGMAGFLKVK